MMGDHSKAAINTAFNTATVVGVSANVFGSGFPPAFVPSFSWGGGEGLTTYRLDKGIDTARTVMSRREIDVDQYDRSILSTVFKLTSGGRTWDSQG